MKKPISATIITLNEENTIQTCIQNISQLCNEVVVLDSYSKDKTTDIAKKLGAKVFFQSKKNLQSYPVMIGSYL